MDGQEKFDSSALLDDVIQHLAVAKIDWTVQSAQDGMFLLMRIEVGGFEMYSVKGTGIFLTTEKIADALQEGLHRVLRYRKSVWDAMPRNFIPVDRPDYSKSDGE